jgi:hypothetical protein
MESVSAALLAIFRGTESHGPWLIACLEGAWPGLIGEKAAAVCRPASVNDAELIIEVLDPDWLPALAGMRSRLLERIRTFTGDEVRKLSLVKKASRCGHEPAELG